jgi:hypothetical protein
MHVSCYGILRNPSDHPFKVFETGLTVHDVLNIDAPLLPHHLLTRQILVEYSNSMIVHLLRVNINLGASVAKLSHHLKQISKGGLSF